MLFKIKSSSVNPSEDGFPWQQYERCAFLLPVNEVARMVIFSIVSV